MYFVDLHYFDEMTIFKFKMAILCCRLKFICAKLDKTTCMYCEYRIKPASYMKMLWFPVCTTRTFIVGI